MGITVVAAVMVTVAAGLVAVVVSNSVIWRVVVVVAVTVAAAAVTVTCGPATLWVCVVVVVRVVGVTMQLHALEMREEAKMARATGRGLRLG